MASRSADNPSVPLVICSLNENMGTGAVHPVAALAARRPRPPRPHGDWRLGTCGLDGRVDVLATGQHDGTDPDGLVTRLRSRVRRVARSLGERLVGVGVAVPGPTADDRLVHATMLGWHDVDIGRLAPA